MIFQLTLKGGILRHENNSVAYEGKRTCFWGTFWDKEKGLNEYQYIVPGAGGLGEILNNAFV